MFEGIKMNLKRLVSAFIALALTGCSTIAPAQAPLPTVVLGNGTPAATTGAPSQSASTRNGSISASGVVVPADQVQISTPMAERVKALNVKEGDTVNAGDVLLQLDDESAQAQLAQANAALATAQANYNLLAAGATAEQLRQAEAAVVSATANYSRTVSGPRRADIVAAQAAYDAANQALLKIQAGPQPEDISTAQAALQSAEAALKQAQYAYDNAFRRDPAGIGANPASLALEQATIAYNASKSAYDKVAKPADAAQISAALQQVESARAALERARTPARDYDIAQAKSQIEAAQAQLDALKAGPRAQQLNAAKAQITSAQTQVQAAEAQLKKLSVIAPIAGTVSNLLAHVGEWVTPAQPLLTLADVQHLRVETTDLSELDVVNVKEGQAVTVLVKALYTSVPGKVTRIATNADTLGGDVVYKTTIELRDMPTGLRAGMSVDVNFAAP
jgi:HlyD family secretion protein